MIEIGRLYTFHSSTWPSDVPLNEEQSHKAMMSCLHYVYLMECLSQVVKVHFLFFSMCVCQHALTCSVVSQLFATPIDCNLPGSSDPEVFQAGILEWGCNALPQGIFLTQPTSLGLLDWQAGFLPLAPSWEAFFLFFTTSITVFYLFCISSAEGPEIILVTFITDII